MPIFDGIQAVLFDLDGTLVETNIDFPLMKNEMLSLSKKNGIDPNILIDLDILKIIDKTEELLINKQMNKEAFEYRNEAVEILEEIEIRHAKSTKEIPYASDMINCIKAYGIKTGIVTRNCKKACCISLHITGLEADIVICREDTVKCKPHPEHMLTALRYLETDANCSVTVGDHIMDIQAGKSAGTKTIGFLREDRPKDFFDNVKPDYIANSLKEVMDAIVHCDCKLEY